MLEKKEKVLTVAKSLFSNKGYTGVSMQSLAEACNMSKASIYKLFHSKETLLQELIQHNHEKMIKDASLIDMKQDLDAREKFLEKVVLELSGFKSNKEFIQMLSMLTQTVEMRSFKEHFNKIRYHILQWHKKSILQLYGTQVEPMIWDLVTALNGLVKEFLYLVAMEELPISEKNVSLFIMDVLDAIVEKRTGKQTLIEDALITTYFATEEELSDMDIPEMLRGVFSVMQSKVSTLSKDEHNLDEIQSTVLLLEEEMNKEEQQVFLIHALIGFLEQIEELGEPVSQLKIIIGK